MPMRDQEPSSLERLEQAREVVWDALQQLEEAQRVLFKAGDRYVAQVWGDGVRAVIELTERLTDMSGNLSAVHIELGRLVRKDQSRDTQPPEEV